MTSKQFDGCYFILETVRSGDGQYIPCIAERNKAGYYRTDWKWGMDLALARKLCDEANERLGLSKNEALTIQLSSMFPRPDNEIA